MRRVALRKTFKLALYVGLAILLLLELPSTVLRTCYRYAGNHELASNGKLDEALQFVREPVVTPSPEIKVEDKPLGTHKYRPDGLLEVNEDGAHPIYELISRAEKEWDERLQNASKTLGEAVREYERRYKRPPPKGFDLWWDYTVRNKVQLPDEYDQIYKDLEPFWGIEPADLIKIHEENEEREETYTIGKNESTEAVELLVHTFREGTYDALIKGVHEIMRTFKTFQQYLPPFRMTFTPHDSPNKMSDYFVKEMALKAAAAKTYVSRSSFPRPQHHGWLSGCAPGSPARRQPIDLDRPPPLPSQKTFIYNHPLAMDPCNHPDHFYHHGQFISHGLGPSGQPAMVPEFGYCSTTLHHNIRFPIPYLWVEDIYPRSHDPEWADKVDERLLWRGSTTGIYHSDSVKWWLSHREALVWATNDLEEMARVLPSNTSREERMGTVRQFKKAHINPAVFDIAFAGKPIGCNPEICDAMEDLYPFREWQGYEEAGRYKYVFDVDGNGWSGRFKRLITSNSLVFKSTLYPEWYADRIQPWVHYIPVQLDLSDLYDSFLFFRGDGNGDGAHDDLAAKIAKAGRHWSKTFWRRQDLAAYAFRLTLEYARLMSLDRDAMSYHHTDVSEGADASS